VYLVQGYLLVILVIVIARFASPHAILHKTHVSISPCKLLIPFFKSQSYFFHIYAHFLLYSMRICRLHHYSLRTLGNVPKIEKWCRVSMSRQEINDHWSSIYWKRSDSTLQFYLKAINGPILSYGKEEKEFNFESKVTLEELFTSH
jgi:hypothetical protein